MTGEAGTQWGEELSRWTWKQGPRTGGMEIWWRLGHTGIETIEMGRQSGDPGEGLGEEYGGPHTLSCWRVENGNSGVEDTETKA